MHACPRVDPSTVIDLDKADTEVDQLSRGVIPPDGSGRVHPLVQRVAIGEVDEVVKVEHVVHLPDRLLAAICSGSAQGEGDLGAFVGEREGNRLRGGNDAERVRVVGHLEPENLILDIGVGLVHVLEGANLLAGVIPSLVKVEGGDGERGVSGKEDRATDVSGDSIGHDFVTPSVLQASDAHDGVVETPGEDDLSLGMGTGHINLAIEAVGDQSGDAFVVRSVRNRGRDILSPGIDDITVGIH